MKDLIPLFRIDLIDDWESSKEKTWNDAEKHYEQLLKELKKNLNHLVYLCSPLRPTKRESIQDNVVGALDAASQILGAKYNGKKIAVYVPHLHMFSIYNEIIYPERRERAFKFNDYLIGEYFHTLMVIGNRISKGMASEIELARKKGIRIIKIKDFKKQLKNLPDLSKSKASFKKMVRFHNKVHGPGFLIGK